MNAKVSAGDIGRRLNPSAMIRADVSTALPGAESTMSRTGREG